MRNFDKVEIEWLDSSHTSGWLENYPNDDLKCRSVGYLLEKTNKSIRIVQSLAEGQSDAMLEIPISSVLKYKKL